jgi:hypothetical protein
MCVCISLSLVPRSEKDGIANFGHDRSCLVLRVRYRRSPLSLHGSMIRRLGANLYMKLRVPGCHDPDILPHPMLTTAPPCSHFVLLLCVGRYALSWMRMNYYRPFAQFCYRFAFISAAATYGIVVYKTWRARQKTGAKQPGGPLGYLSDENIQYLRMWPRLLRRGRALLTSQSWRLCGSSCRSTLLPCSPTGFTRFST